MSLAIVLSVIFMILKLTHVIAWSWFWVVSPLIAGAVLNIAAAAIWFKLAFGKYTPWS